MRRTIAAAVMGGLVLGGAAATPFIASVHGAGKAPDVARIAATVNPRAGSTAKEPKITETAKENKTNNATVPMKDVVYEGYEFQVPASWPVYRLDEHPQTCVRYDVHAVYLGTPGTDMRCPAGLIGRTETVSFIPGQHAPASGVQLQRLPAVHSTLTQNAAQYQLEVPLGTAAPGATILGTYGTDPAATEQVLKTLHVAPAGAVPTVQSAPAQTSAPPSPGNAAALERQSAAASPERTPSTKPPSKAPASARATPNATTYTTWRGVPTNRPTEIVSTPPKPTPTPTPNPAKPVNGFDTCAAPSLATMLAWRSEYSAAGIYIGGVNSACSQVDLSAAWIKSAASKGWAMLPTYVGPQAPCWTGSGIVIASGSAAAEGKAAASNAVGDARKFGLATGSAVYYDMEGFGAGASCTNAVLTFLGAWDRQMVAGGYVTGVYSSQDSGIAAMQAGVVGKVPGFTQPRAIWFALWDNKPILSDGILVWPLTDRSKQYAGAINKAVGGITLNIDEDFVGGPMAR
jgi:hypothetical protein